MKREVEGSGVDLVQLRYPWEFRPRESVHFAWCIKTYLWGWHLLFNNRVTLKATVRVRLLKLIATPKRAILPITPLYLTDVMPRVLAFKESLRVVFSLSSIDSICQMHGICTD